MWTFKLRDEKLAKYIVRPAKVAVWTLRGELRSRLRIAQEYRLVVASGLFDVAFYRQQCRESLGDNPDPLRHYLTVGYREGCNPNPLFDSQWYLTQNPSVAYKKANPLVHFIQRGWREGCDPHPLFHTSHYLRTNPDVAEQELNPLHHFLSTGFKENRDPNPLFDCAYYLQVNSDVSASGANPLVHYVFSGANELRNPHPLFDAGYYVRSAQVSVNRGVNPLEHYFDTGIKGHFSPHPLFDVRFYRTHHSDILTKINDPLQHFLEVGAKLGYDPCELFDSSFYSAQYPEVERVGKNPLVHYVTEGANGSFNPNPLFDTAFYLKQNPDVAKSGQNPLVHYMETGALEGRAAGPFFDSQFYLRKNPRVLRARINPLVHYLSGAGVAEGCDPNPFFSTSGYREEHPELEELGANPLVHFLGLDRPGIAEDATRNVRSVHVPDATPDIQEIGEESPNVTAPGGIHLLLDLTDSSSASEAGERILRELTSPSGVGGRLEHATVLLRSASQLQQVTWQKSWTVLFGGNWLLEAGSAIENARNSESHLLVIFGPVSITTETLESLTRAFDVDPHFGISVPRELDWHTGELLKVMDRLGDYELSELPPQVLSHTSEYYITPELQTRCMLIRNVIVSNLRLPDRDYETFAAGFQSYLCSIRRAGFRTVILNRACVHTLHVSKGPAALMSRHDLRKFHSQNQDAGRARIELVEAPFHLHESLLGRWLAPIKKQQRSLLLDVRGVPSHFNGTAEAVLAVCDGIKEIGTDWNVVLWAKPEAARYHSMHLRYAPWPVLTEGCDRHFTVAFRPSQPWHVNTLLDLHRSALINLFTMLDTISWDILCEAPIGLGACWDFMCQHADGLIYDSFYTRDHMLRRFPAADSLPSYVSHLSFNPKDYAVADRLEPANSGDYIFVIGNGYDHKHLRPTIDLLVAAFPFAKIKVLGLEAYEHPSVQAWGSGKLAASEIETLFAGAQVIVFPSFYEGFGFPVLKGLSYGRTVIARGSALLSEIAANYRGPGKLLQYSTPSDLVKILRRVMQGHTLNGLALGSNLAEGKQPRNWHDVARGLLAFIEGQLSHPEQFRWELRERAFRQVTTLSE